MNKDWSEKNKEMQRLLGNKTTYKAGIEALIELREELFQQISYIVNGYPHEAFSQMPFAGADGYHSKTLIYSIWHIFRIEDIVAHSLIKNDEQILFADDYLEKTKSPIITTGNELQGEEIINFSKRLNVREVYEYAKSVMLSTNAILRELDYSDFKRGFGEEEKNRLLATQCISNDEKASWLIDYWCKKDIRGLIKMPFSRHWIMHIEAMQRIKNKLCKLARKGVDPVAYCGFSCNHCFLGQWCGSCRTEYNACSFATCSPDGKCPNVSCCQQRNIDGCFECDELENCQEGFYVPSNDGANAAKAQAMFIRKYGKKAFLLVHDLLHEKHDFAKTQEILGQDMYKGFEILENTYLEREKDERKDSICNP